jgi:hypothetical protein
VFFPISQYYFSRLECFPCQPVLFFLVGECFSLSASIIFLGWRVFFPVSQYYFSRWESVFPCQSVLFF